MAQDNQSVEGFTIRWEPSFGSLGGYRVSVPQLSPNGERVHVVRREDYDRLVAERDALQARIVAADAILLGEEAP